MNQEELNVDEAQVGRILHVVLSENGRFLCRPAICIYDAFPVVGTITVKAFTHGQDFLLEEIRPDHKNKTPTTWHWPRECRNLHA